jgi:hypothetical protein
MERVMTPDYGPAFNVRLRWKMARMRMSIRDGIASIKAGFAFVRMTRKPRRLSECSPEQKAVFLALMQGEGRG